LGAENVEYRDMAFEDLITKINLFLSDVEHEPEDPHELLEQLHLEINQMRATGQPVPDDLARLVKALEDEFSLRGMSNGDSDGS
jgi:hypothetical protein